MTRINIAEFGNYDNKAIYEFLFLQSETVFEIIIPRAAIAGNCDNYDIVHEYLAAAYAGQRLAEIASSFAYYVPCVYNSRSVLFEVTITDMEKFTDILYLIVQGFDYTAYENAFLTFHGLAADFLNDAFEEKIECKTWGLLYIANQYL